jgi:cytoskeletal protein RodZ
VQRDDLTKLAEIRKSRGVSLEQISNATKITVRCLQAIENGEFKKLPGGIYNTSYIRQYARAIDLDESELLAYYNKITGNTADNPTITGTKPENVSNFRFLLQH